MARPKISRALRQLLADEHIKIYAFFGMKHRDEPPYFFAGVAPAEESTAIWDPDLIYATAEGDSPESAIEAFRQKMWRGL